MKKFSFTQLLILLVSTYSLFASDTIVVRTIDYNKPKYGWFEFPDANETFEKILMNYTIKCPCGEWDYIANVYVKQFYLPSFRVDGLVVGSLVFRNDTSWSYLVTGEEGNYTIDSIPIKPLEIKYYETDGESTIIKQTKYVWLPYYRYFVNVNGNIDSVFVGGDDTIYLQKQRVFYKDEITLAETFEIMRFITPYGIGLNVGEDGFSWVIDASDFLPLLTGKVYIDAPNQQQEINITFDFIKGVPERNIKRLERIWVYPYLVYNKDTEEKLSAREISLMPEEKMVRLKVIQTGHGFGGNEDNCCEFCRKNAFVKVNDEVKYTREVWRECSNNALFPQGGTWLLDRTNWCPGAVVYPFDFEITPHISNSTFKLDYDMEFYNKPYQSGSNTVGYWVITSYLVVYDSLNFKLDAEIADIVRPSKKDIYLRYNPSATSPIIIVRNRGSETISKIEFEYGIEGSKVYTYTWEGSINSLESAEIALPPVDYTDWASSSKKFVAKIMKVNDVVDEYTYNNISVSEYNLPSSYYQNLSINLLTNNFNVLFSNYNGYKPYKLRLLSADGKEVFSRNDYQPSTQYSDTINLENGGYELIFENSLNCGLGFWYYQYYYQLNNGNLNIKSDDILLYQFPVDFGSEIRHSFIVDYQPTALFAPDSLHFGNVLVGNSKTFSMIVKPANNKGIALANPQILMGATKGLKIEKITPELNQNGEAVLNEGDSLIIDISFTPNKAGKVSSSLTFSTNDRKKGTISIPILGYGVNPDDVSSSLEQNDFDIYFDKSSNSILLNIRNGFFHIQSVEIYSLLGDLLHYSGEILADNKVELLRCGINIANGVYIVKITSKEGIIAKPVIVVSR